MSGLVSPPYVHSSPQEVLSCQSDLSQCTMRRCPCSELSQSRELCFSKFFLWAATVMLSDLIKMDLTICCFFFFQKWIGAIYTARSSNSLVGVSVLLHSSNLLLDLFATHLSTQLPNFFSWRTSRGNGNSHPGMDCTNSVRSPSMVPNF